MWQSETVASKEVDLFLPNGEVTDRVVLFLHDFDLRMLRESDAYTQQLAEYGLTVIAPHGGVCWWLDVACPLFDESVTPLEFITDQLLPHYQQQWQRPLEPVGLLGIGIGGQGVLQLSYRNARRFPVVAAVATSIDLQLWYGTGTALDVMFPDEESLRQTSVLLQLHPLSWPRRQLLVCDPDDPASFDGTARLASKLSSSGILYDADLETRAGGHTWDYFDTMAPAVIHWLANALARS